MSHLSATYLFDFTLPNPESTTSTVELGDLLPSMELRQLIPTVATSPGDISSHPLLVVQITSFRCGGVCLRMGCHHTLADGTGALHFMKSWSGLARGLSITIPPFLERTILCRQNPPKSVFHHVEYDPPPTMKTPSKNTKSQSMTNLKITVDHVNTLKAKAQDKENQTNYTTFQVLTTHIWRCVSKARRFSDGDQETKLRISVDGRSRLNPPLPQSYFGNVIFTASPIALSGDLSSESLTQTVDRINKAINRMDDEYLRSAFHYLEEVGDVTTNIMRGSSTCACPNLAIASWLRLPFYEVGFGWGPPSLMRPASMFEGKGYIHPCPTNDGSLSLGICLETDHMDSFQDIFYDF